MFKNYLTVTFRNLSRNKVSTFINIAGLSLGLACAMLIILYVKDELSFDRFHENGPRLYRVVSENTDKDGRRSGYQGNTGLLQGPKFTANVPGIDGFVRLKSGSEDIKQNVNVKSVDVMYADSAFFSLFTFPMLSGDPKTCLKDPKSVVLSAKKAIELFGTVNATGKRLPVKRKNAFEPYTVSAVVADLPGHSSIQFSMLMPLIVQASEEQRNESWFNVFLNTFVLLSPNADVKRTEANMQRFYKKDSKTAKEEMTKRFGEFGDAKYMLQPFGDMHLDTNLPPDNGLYNASKPVYSYILSGIALLILFIACINFVNLTIARSVRRAKEIGIRKVVGGERKQLIVQFLSESFLLCLLSFVLALILSTLVLPVFNTLSGKTLALANLLDLRLIAGFLALYTLTALLAGFYPALVLSGYKPVETLYSRFTIGGKNYLQKSLVVFQFALSSILIIATLTIYYQFDFLTHEKLGYEDADLITVNKNMLGRDEAAYFRTELMKNPAILGVAAKNGGFWGTAAKIANDSTMQFAWETIDEEFVPLLHIQVKEGRNFSRAFPADSGMSVLVNEAFVKKAGWRNPIGQQLNFWYENDKRFNVVGVVKDYHFSSLSEEIRPQVFTMRPQNTYGMVYIRVRHGQEKNALAHIRKTFMKQFPDYPYNYDFKRDANRRNYESEKRWKNIMLFSALLTVFISCIGLFGLSVLSAEKRTKEIGIRKVLGASVNHVVLILSRDFLLLVVLALFFAVPLAWYATSRWLQDYPYRINLSWTLFAGAGGMVVLIALATVSFQAIKAALANPVKSLRSE